MARCTLRWNSSTAKRSGISSKAGRLPAHLSANLFRQIGNALMGSVENMMMRDAPAANEALVLIDSSMAIVKDLDKSIHGLSHTGGTVHYMAPEQAIGYASSEADLLWPRQGRNRDA
jgi:hypothetical protein